MLNTRPLVRLVLIALLAGVSPAAAQPLELYVLCDLASHEVSFAEAFDESSQIVMAGPLPGPRTAERWISDHCRNRRCTSAGGCAGEAAIAEDLQGWLVLCNPEAGEVGLLEAPAPLRGFEVLAGPLATEIEAQEWAEENCPAWRCDPEGRCENQASAEDGGWVAGEVTAVSLGSGPGSGDAGLVPGSGEPGLSAPTVPAIGYIGVTVGRVDQSAGARDVKGVLIEGVATDRPAHEAGIQAGDVVLKADGRPAEGPAALMRYIVSRVPGVEMSLEIRRQASTLRRVVRVGALAGPDSGSLGIQVRSTDDSQRARGLAGAVVVEARPGTAGAAAGIRAGDIVVSVEGRTVAGVSDLLESLAFLRARTEVTLGIVRGDRSLRSTAVLAPRPDSSYLGFDVRRLPESVLAEGLEVDWVFPGLPAEQAGVLPGDQILAVDGRPFTTPNELFRYVRGLAPGTDATLDLRRGGRGFRTTVRLASNHDMMRDALAMREPGMEGAARRAAGPPSPSRPASPTVAGPGAADLSPLIDNAKSAAGGCAYPAALASADQMAEFDPEHPWLVANHDKLRRLAQRQGATEDAVWKASDALTREDLDTARDHASAATHSAVACQSQAVVNLLAGIDAAIAQRKAERTAARRQAAGELLVGLMQLRDAIIEGSGSTTSAPPSAPGASTSGNPGAATGPDPCAFKYEYRNRWNFEPYCTCPGYRFEPRQHRCVKGTSSGE